MKGSGKKSFWKKVMSLTIAFGLCISGVGIAPVGNVQAQAANVIEISSAADLQKIGTDDSFPLNGDYKLIKDIDLSGVENFTPIGGGEGTRGSFSGNNVFSGTFDGAGHLISNLHILEKNDNARVPWQYGLFGIIGSADPNKKAAVRNLILTNVDIYVDMIDTTASQNAFLSLGGLAGEVNRNAEIDNVAVVGGTIRGNNSNRGDVVGAGGLIGEMRPEDKSETEDSGVTIRDIYVDADVVCGSSTTSNYAGGIIGRVTRRKPASVTSCLFAGTVSYKDEGGYGISGGDVKANFSSCYYRSGLSNTGKAISTEQLQAAELLEGLDSSKWTATAGNNMILTQCVNSNELRETLALSALKLNLASGDTFSSVSQNFTVPTSLRIGTETEPITWKSDNETVISVNPTDGTVQVTPQLGAVNVTLTVTTKSGKTRSFTLTVKANLNLEFDQEYAKIGEAVTASLTGAPADTTCTYTWSVDGVSKGTAPSYTPAQEDLEKMLSVTAQIEDSSGNSLGECGPIQMFISKLPVVYINTDDGTSIDSKTDYEGASMRVQGNDEFQQSAEMDLYDGDIEIRGRGNSTWNSAFHNGGKRPYKIKLGKKRNLLGFGESKHWALLANYMDESLLRNKTSYDLAGEMGIEPHLPSTHVELILNGAYVGNYQLVGNVRIQESRVNIFNWEDLAEDAAEAIAKAEAANGNTLNQSALEDYMNQNMQWITSGSVSFQGKTYKISDYAIAIPKNSSGGVDVSGGFLFELDGYYDEVSKFRTKTYQPIMFKSPEFIRPTTGAGEGSTEKEDTSKQNCGALYNYAHEYIQAVEDTVHSPDYSIDIEETQSSENASNFTTDFKGRQHYTDLVDMDSLVKYLLLNEFYWNTETMKKSTFMYKDLGKKLQIGPVWDMDWTSNSLISRNETSNYESWMVVTRQAGSHFQEQKESWYRYLIGDPYFVEKLYECYWDYRKSFEDIAKDNGIIDQQKAYLAESGDSNYQLAGSFDRSLEAREEDRGKASFDAGVNRLKTFLQNRLNWMDQQFGWPAVNPDAASSKTVVDGLLASFQKYQDTEGKISVTADTASSDTKTTYTASVTDASIPKVGFYINGILAGSADVTNGKAVLELDDGTAGLVKNIEKKAYVNNVVQARAMDASGNLMTVKGSYNGESIDVCISGYTLFQKEIKADKLTGTVTVSGLARVGQTLKAAVSDTNNTGELLYQWKADGVAIDRATKDSYKLTDAEEGKTITVEVRSNWETDFIESAPTESVIKVEVLNDHLIINQVFGGGANNKASIGHSFIELYNPTESKISLSGYKIGYYSGRKDAATGEPENGYTEKEVYLTLDAAKEVPPKHSYLIRCEAQESSEVQDYMLKIENYDQQWENQTIANKRYKVVLYLPEVPDAAEVKMADGVSVNEDMVEGLPLTDLSGKEILSKHKTVRRIKFADTDNNIEDFEVISYRSGDITEAEIEKYRPRCLADGAWDAAEPEPVVPTELKGSVSIRGNAVVGAHLYADVALDADSYTSENIDDFICTWKADGKAITGVTGRFLQTDASYQGKTISVEVTAADEKITGTLQAAMASAFQTVEAQRKHVIINQVYGDGGKSDVPLSHSFIELYNPTNAEVDLSGYSIFYQCGDDIKETLSLSGKIPSRHSYLIRCKEAKSTGGAVAVSKGDAEWNLEINNKQYRILLKNGENQIDGVSVNGKEGEAAEGAPLTDPSEGDSIISKNKAIRRINFVDTDQNAQDFEVLNYTNLNEWNLTKIITDVKPRSSADGAWGLEIKDNPVEPDKEILEEADTAKTAAEQLEAMKSQYTADSYREVQTAYEALLRALESKDEELIKQATEDLNQAITGLKKIDNPQRDDEKKKSLAGTQFLYQKGWYVVTKDSGTEYTVTYLKPEKKTLKSAKVPPTVSKDGVSYRVTAIADKAFAKNKKLKSVTIGKNVETIGKSAFAGDGKLKKITVQTTVLKSVGAKALKGVSAECKIKVPKKLYKAYVKKFKKKGQKSTVRIVK